MTNATSSRIKPVPSSTSSAFRTLLHGYRFRVCEDEESAARAVALRRDGGDAYDTRSWLLVAEHVATGETVGTLRITPRLLGPLAAEEHVALPRDLALAKSFELSRLEIACGARSSTVAAVTAGLFKLAYEFCLYMGSECQIACADRETAATYVAFGFRETAPVASAGGRVLLAHDFRRAGTGLRGNRFHELFCELDVAEVVLPARTPQLGLAADVSEPPYRLAVGA